MARTVIWGMLSLPPEALSGGSRSLYTGRHRSSERQSSS